MEGMLISYEHCIGNSYSQSKSTYDSSIIAKKIAESMENDIDFL